MWGFNYTNAGFLGINKEGEDKTESQDSYLDHSQKQLCIFLSEDTQLNLNNSRIRVQVPIGDRECQQITFACAVCNSMCIMIYKCELRCLKDQSPFR